MNKRVPPPQPSPRITGVKFSAIAPAGVNPVSGTQFLAVTGGTTDNLYTIDQIAASVGSIGVPITLTGDVTGSGTGTIATTATGLHGFPVSSTTPTLNQVLQWTGSAWAPETLIYGQMTWVPYTTLGQAFVSQNLTRDGDWTMVAKTNTTDRPSPQPSGAEEDLLPAWTPNRQSAVGALTIYNEWTINTGGWIDQYGVDIIRQNVGDTHTISLSVNGSIRDTFTAVAANERIYWHDILPIVVATGSVLRVTLQISATGSNSWFEQVGLVAAAPVYCSSAVGSLNGAAGGTTAYNCHLRFTPGAASPNWDIVSYSGQASGGGGGGPEPIGAWTIEGNPTGSTTTPTAFTIGSLTAKTTPASTDQLLLQDNAASGALKSVPWSSLPSGGGGMSIGGAGTSGTPGSVLFIDGSSNLAQDNAKFFWDDTNYSLNISGSPALYKVPSGTGDNWFFGDSGNFTTGSSGNAGIGHNALHAVTTGNFNMAIGSFSLQNLTTGRNNVGVGTNAMSFLTTGQRNIAIGNAALDDQNNDESVAIGDNALGNYNDWGSVGIGLSAAFGLSSGVKNVFIGYQCGYNLNSPSNRNVWFGGYGGGPFTVNDTIVFSNGDGNIIAADFGLTNSNIWSFAKNTTAVGLNIYNTKGGSLPPVNYERAIFDWNYTPNVLSIGTQAGGTGTVRPMQFIGIPTKTTPVGADQILLQDSASSNTLKWANWSSLPSGGGGGMSIGGAITGGTAGNALMVGPGSVLAQTTNLPVSVLNSGTFADSGHFWRGDGTWASGFAPAPYSPLQLGTALRAWYEMDKLTGSAGSSQASIADQSGNGYGLSQPTTANQGTLAVADLNGLNTLRFTAANQSYYQLALAILSGATAGSMYMVYKVVSTSAWNAMLDWGTSPAGFGDWPYSDGNIY